MTGLLKKTILASALAATGIATASPAMARDYGERRHDDGAGTAIAVGLGILGIAAVAAIASSHHDKCDGDRDDPRYCYDRRGYNEGYYNNGGYYRGGYNGGYYNGGYYNDRDRHDHDGRYYGRGYDNDYRGGYRGW